MEIAAPSVLTRDEMETRRLEAARDLLNGIPQAEVARKFGVSRTTASRWSRALEHSGLDGMRKRRAPGRPSKLNSEQMSALAAIYQAGPRAAGFASPKWTTARFAKVIYARFGIQYDPDHAGRIMLRLGLRTPRQKITATHTAIYAANCRPGQPEAGSVASGII